MAVASFDKYGFGASNGANDHSAFNGSAASLDMSTMRDVENLLEFHRLRDLFSESVASLGKAAAAPQSLQGTKPPANRGGGAAGGRGRGRGGVRPGGRGGGRNGGGRWRRAHLVPCRGIDRWRLDS